MFDADEIRKACSIDLVEIHNEISSTNDRAIELIRSDQSPKAAIVVAKQQLAGRGQRDRQWWSNEGSLTFTLVKKIASQSFGSLHLKFVPLAAALAVVDAVESCTRLSGLEVKWPNDVLVSNRKLSGILVESIASPDSTSLVVGIGVNVNNSEFPQIAEIEAGGFSETTSFSPSSLLIETGVEISQQPLLIEIVNRLSNELVKLVSNQNDFVERYNKRIAFLNQKISLKRKGDHELNGLCKGVDENGALLIETSSKTHEVFSGTLRSEWRD